MSAALLLCTLLAQVHPQVEASPAPAVRYVLGAWREPPPTRDGLQLVDLAYSARDEGATRHAFAARLRLGALAYVGFESDGERRGVSLLHARATLRLDEEEGSWHGFGAWRGRRVLAELDLRRRSASDGRGLIVGGLVAPRLSQDVELVARFVGDTRPAPHRLELPDRFLRAASLGLLWQRGASFEAFAEAGHARVRTSGGLEFERDEWALDASGAWRGAELGGALGYERSHGRFPHDEWRAELNARVPLARRLLADVGVGQRVEPGLRRVALGWQAALHLHARAVRLPRAGAAARRAALLARQAIAQGYQERRVFGDDERLEQRRRLALGASGAALADELAALHRAQVEERLVPLLGAEASLREDALTGLTERRYGLLLGLAWPPAWPWQAHEESAPFLRLGLTRLRDTYASGLIVRGSAFSLTAELSRESALEVRWTRPGRAPLDLVRNAARADGLEIAYRYAFAR